MLNRGIWPLACPVGCIKEHVGDQRQKTSGYQPVWLLPRCVLLDMVIAFPILGVCVCKRGTIIPISWNCEDNSIRAPAHYLQFSWNPVNIGFS